MSRPPTRDELRPALERLQQEDPALGAYIEGLERTIARQQEAATRQRAAAGLLGWFGVRVLLGGDLRGAVRSFTDALDDWLERLPGQDGRPRRFPTQEAGQVGAELAHRFVRVGVVGGLLALIPALLLVVQTGIMWQQNEYFRQQNQLVQDQFDQQRRVQFLSLLYDPDPECRRRAEKTHCPPVASPRARAEAARGLVELARRQGARVDLTAVDLRDVHLDRAHLEGARMGGARMGGASLVKATLSGAELVGAELIGAALDGAVLSDATLSGATFDEASMARADLRRATASGASLKDTDLTGANMSGFKGREAVLTNADLTDADLTGADLFAANLGGARLEGASLAGANLASASLQGANLKGATFDDQTTWPRGFKPEAAGAQRR